MSKLIAGIVAALIAFGPSAGLVMFTAITAPVGVYGSCTPTQTSGGGGGTGGPIAPEKPPESARVVMPLPEATWVRTDGFGWRFEPFTGLGNMHTGLDMAAPDGTPILAAADGTVTVAEYSVEWGGLVVIEHTIGGNTIATAYAHSWQHGIHVTPGTKVTAGQHIADVGSSGYSTGAHLHFEVRPGGTYATAIDPEPWLAAQGAIGISGGSGGGGPTPAGACHCPSENENENEDGEQDAGTQEKGADG